MKTQSAIRFQVALPGDGIGKLSTADQWDIEIVKVAKDSETESDMDSTMRDLFLTAIDELQHEDHTYPNTALLAVKILATEQLSTTLPEITTIVEGLKPAGTYSRNPVRCLLDFCSNKRYGLGEFLVEDDNLLSPTDHAAEIAYCDALTGAAGDVGLHNGSFGSAWKWETFGGWAINAGKAIHSETLVGHRSQDVLAQQGMTIHAGHIYTVTFTVSSITPGENPAARVRVSIGGTSGEWRTAPGTYEQDIGPVAEDGLFWMLARGIVEIDALSIVDKGEPRFQLDIVVDTEEPALDKITSLASTFRGAPVWTDGMLRFVIDRDETPVFLYTMGNIITDTFKEGFKPVKDRYNQIEIQFVNYRNDFRKDFVVVSDREALEAGDPIRKKTVFMSGVTRRSQAERMAWYFLYSSKYISRSVQFKAGVDAIVCTAGDIVNFAHDVPQWGTSSGRLAAGTLTTVTLPEAITLKESTTYKVMIRHGNDDVLETREIDETAGTYPAGTALNVTPAFTAAPAAYDVYSVGEVDILVKPYRVMALCRESEHEVALALAEHNVAVFTEDADVEPPLQYSALLDPRLPPPPVEDLQVYTTDSYDFLVRASYQIPQEFLQDGNFDHVEFLLCDDIATVTTKEGDEVTLHCPAGWKDQSEWMMVGTSTSDLFNLYMPEGIPGQIYWLRAITVSKMGVRSLVQPEKMFTYVVGTPPNVTGLELIGQGNDHEWRGRSPTFTWKDVGVGTEFEEIGFGREPMGAGQGALRRFFRDYVIRIVKTDRTFVMRDFTSAAQWTYLFEKNSLDNAGSPLRTFAIQVYARDVFNQVSPVPAEITVFNLAPDDLPIVCWPPLWGNWGDARGYLIFCFESNPSGVPQPQTQRAAVVRMPMSSRDDLVGIHLHSDYNDNKDFIPTAGNLIYAGPIIYTFSDVGWEGDTARFSFQRDSLQWEDIVWGESPVCKFGFVDAFQDKPSEYFILLPIKTAGRIPW